jgi:NAD(P)-dependent dehydrogenase (short-subunit alcohol dehydrogenase family)
VNLPAPDTRTIFITGAAAGIGRAAALLFAEKGWFVGLYDVDGDGLETLAAGIGPERCCAGKADVTDEESMRRAVAHFGERAGGRMNVLFNNAGIIRAGGFGEIPAAEQRRVLDINVWGIVNTTIQSLPLLKATSPARVINMSSASAIYGHPQLTAYAASKMAVRSLTQGLDLALRPHGIAVCDVMPMWAKTGLADAASAQWTGLRDRDIRLTPERIARVVWKAAHGRRLHWRVGWKTWYYHFVSRLLPERLGRLAAHMILKDPEIDWL